jgi:hypothetical protein
MGATLPHFGIAGGAINGSATTTEPLNRALSQVNQAKSLSA